MTLWNGPLCSFHGVFFGATQAPPYTPRHGSEKALPFAAIWGRNQIVNQCSAISYRTTPLAFVKLRSWVQIPPSAISDKDL